MGSLKYPPADLPRVSAAPMYLSANKASAVAMPSPTVVPNSINGPVTFDEMPRHLRRHIDLKKRTVNPATKEAAQPHKQAISPTSDRIIRLPELLAILQISRSTAFAWQKAGLLPHSVALGPRVRGWRLSDIDRFLASLSAEERDD